MEPASSRILVRFITAEPQWELLVFIFYGSQDMGCELVFLFFCGL